MSKVFDEEVSMELKLDDLFEGGLTLALCLGGGVLALTMLVIAII
jgi:hypothetical protein